MIALDTVHKVPYGMNVSVVLERSGDDLVRVRVLAPLYITKNWYMKHSYSAAFTDAEILSDVDFVRVMCDVYTN